jgi:hypothetical protein
VLLTGGLLLLVTGGRPGRPSKAPHR